MVNRPQGPDRSGHQQTVGKVTSRTPAPERAGSDEIHSDERRHLLCAVTNKG